MFWLVLVIPSSKEVYDIPCQVEYVGVSREAGDLVIWSDPAASWTGMNAVCVS